MNMRNSQIPSIKKIIEWPFASWTNILISAFLVALLLLGIVILHDYYVTHKPLPYPIFQMPVSGVTIPHNPGFLPNSPRYLRNGVHEGIDLEVKENTSVKAARAGKVIEVNDGGIKDGPFYDEKTIKAALEMAKAGQYERVHDIIEGRYIVIEHEKGWKTKYVHLKSIWVEVGQKVKASDTIGLSGCTGYCNEPHLHFAIYKPNGEFLGKGYDELELQLLLHKYIQTK